MAAVPTVKVHYNGSWAYINESDFDPTVHLEWQDGDEVIVAQLKAKAEAEQAEADAAIAAALFQAVEAEPVAEEPVAEEPVAEEPVAEEPVAELESDDSEDEVR